MIVVVIYLSIGIVFSIPFILKGVKVIDEGAIGTKWGFRLIIIPGAIVFWPMLLRKWLKALK